MTAADELEYRHDALIEEYQLFLHGRGPEPDLSELPPHLQETVRDEFRIVRALADRHPELPPIEQDPVADPPRPGRGGVVTTLTPAACRHCPHGERDHMQRWAAGAGWHRWTEPTDQQRLARMRERRNARKATT